MKLHFIYIITILSLNIQAQVLDKSWRAIIYQKEDAWFGSREAQDIADNVLLYQRDIGGWPKNVQIHKKLSDKEKRHLLKLKKETNNITIDNGATTQEMLFLSKMYRQVPNIKYKTAFLQGLNYILEAQYDHGGWPQFYPLRSGYYSHITYNDDAMVNVLKLLKELKDDTGFYAIKPSGETLQKVNKAFEKGIDCILKTQYVQNGVLTGWCAQYDEHTLLPAKARSYELPSLSGKESAQIVLLLMSIENPSPAIKDAIIHAVEWFERVKITGKNIKHVYANGKRVDKKLISDNNASPLWARFMELDNNKPFFCDRDGIKKETLAEIGQERKVGYAWYTREPQEVLDKYALWNLKNSKSKTRDLNEEYNITVAKDGTGDFVNIQDAIYASKAFPYQRVIIHIKNGVYQEKVHVFDWNTKVSFMGESREKTIIRFNDFFKKMDLGRNSTFHTSTVLVEGNDFIAKNLTIENTAGEVGQAIALSVNANRCYFENCALIGFQDTLYCTGEGYKHYFKNCYIEGSTDFIFGEATVLFQNCIIHSKANSYITAASTPKDQLFGFVFINCSLTASTGVSEVYLGRPWRMYAKTVFIGCEMKNHIKPEGWHNWSNKDAETSTFYAEYKCIGEGYKPDDRVPWSHQLNTSDVEIYTVEHILGTEFTQDLKP
ncbi:pectate lyase [Aestuariivivens sediminis]|uniref:pectate lyase n=1 Tax=Aestuariivivens sediminis TaxID=2913557 RepID=UPI001F56E47B|nr:pectate lyase [Aestuariivivens sediminis]